MSFQISNVSPVVIPSDLPVSRRAPRPVDKRQDDYTERFDYKTVYYDVYRSGDNVVFSGPPLFNFDSVIRVAKFSLYGSERIDIPKMETLWKTQRSSILLNPMEVHGTECKEFKIEAGRLLASGLIQPDENHLFKNSRLLFTMSKNNDLKWISDWATFYHKIHGVDSILVYDNGSTDYSLDELLVTLRAVDGITSAVVVDWPFKYGPGGINPQTWDSDFCQYSAIEHARRRFARDCQGIINADIDELVVTDDGRSIFDHLDESRSGALLFSGRWIENVSDSKDDLPRFVDFKYFDINADPATKKWVVNPKQIADNIQWNVHSFTKGFTPDSPSGISHRHFVGVNSDWKKDRTTRINFDPERHQIDDVLAGALVKAFSV